MSLPLNEIGTSGILFFPVTPFANGGGVEIPALRAHIASRLAFSPDAVFVACGTGEFYGLDLDEYELAVTAAVAEVAGTVPVIAGVGYGAALGAQFAHRAESAGADALLAFPPSATASSQEGLLRHYEALAASTSLPIILYQRDRVRLTAESVGRLLHNESFVGLKDGSGDMESLQQIRLTAGDRWAFFNGMPTAELSTAAFAGLGIHSYSSAVFAFLPEVASAFRRSLVEDDSAVTRRLLEEFYVPLGVLRDRAEGYAVSLIKAGLRIRGERVGSVRPPLVDPTPEHDRELGDLIRHGLELV